MRVILGGVIIPPMLASTSMVTIGAGMTLGYGAVALAGAGEALVGVGTTHGDGTAGAGEATVGAGITGGGMQALDGAGTTGAGEATVGAGTMDIIIEMLPLIDHGEGMETPL